MSGNAPGYIWQMMLDSAQSSGASSNKKLLRKAQADFIHRLPHALSACQRHAALSRGELDKILTHYQASLHLDSYIRLVSSVAKCLQKGKKDLDWDVAIPAIPTKISREPARFTPHLFSGIHLLRSLEQVLLKTHSTESEHLKFGRLILSAIIFGGVVNSKWVEMWIDAFNDRAIVCDGRDIWFELSQEVAVSAGKTEGSEGKRKKGCGAEKLVLHRRWFADPLTSMLLCSWLADISHEHAKISKHHWFRTVGVFLQAGGFDTEKIKSPAQLFQLAETGLSIKVAPFLAAYASRDVISVSLPEPVWARVSKSHPVINNHQHKPSDSEPGADEHEKSPTIEQFEQSDLDSVVPSEQQAILRNIRRLFSKNGTAQTNRTIIRTEIEKILEVERVAPILKLLALWAIRMLAQGASIKASSVRRYLGAIGGHLVALCTQDEFQDLESTEYQEIYEQLLEQIESEKERAYAQGVLGGFHSFLVRDFKYPSIDSSFFSHKKGPPECGVDANLITCAEFDRLKVMLGSEDVNRPEMATAALLIAILGFRCGLRRNEILYLRCRDIAGDTPVELILQPNHLRGLKSRRARRRYILDDLLQPDEYSMLMDWWKLRLERGGNAFLFSPGYRQDRPYRNQDVFTPIRDALHMVTGDTTLSFHHLRHSFATWMLLRLTGTGTGMREKAKFLDHPEFDYARIAKLRKALLDNECLGRKGVYAITMLCGHANPETTFTHYVHLCDWLLGQELHQTITGYTLDLADLASLSGIPLPTIYKHYSRQHNLDWRQLLRIAARRAGLTIYDVADRIHIPTIHRIEFPETARLNFRWVTVMNALRLIQVEKVNLQNVAERTNVEFGALEKWNIEALRIANLRVRDVGKGFRHRVPARGLNRISLYGNIREEWRFKDGMTIKDYSRLPRRTKKHPKLKNHPYKDVWRKSCSQSVHPERFPVEPRTKTGRKTLYDMMTSFEQLTSEEQAQVVEFSEYFCQNFSLNGGGIWYQDFTWAAQHLDALNKLGVPNNRIVLLDLATSGESDAAIRKRRKYWEEGLGLTRASWVVSESRKSFRRISCGVGIQVQEKCGEKSVASYASRYVMYLIRIAYGV